MVSLFFKLNIISKYKIVINVYKNKMITLFY